MLLVCREMESLGYRWRGPLFRLTAPSHARPNGSRLHRSGYTSTLSFLFNSLYHSRSLRSPMATPFPWLRSARPDATSESNCRTRVFTFRCDVPVIKIPRYCDPWLRLPPGLVVAIDFSQQTSCIRTRWLNVSSNPSS